VEAPSGRSYVIGSGVYNDRMERAFVVDAVSAAVANIEKNGDAAFPLFHDPTGPFMAKDAYVFVVADDGTELVNPAFPNLEGRNLLDVKDTQGKTLVREMLQVARTRGAGWVDYMWPKPGDNVSTQKSTYVRSAKVGTKSVVVGCGVYLADAPRATATATLRAPALMSLVRDGAAVFTERGESAYPDFRQKGSKWFRDDTYFFVWTLDGRRVFHAADPAIEGRNVADMKDVLGRPIGRMILDAAASPTGEGWIHYMHPEPGDIFPTWKSTFVKRVTFPSGTQFAIGSGIYNMRMDGAFIEDVVNRAADLVGTYGSDAFAQLRDKTGPFVFLDTYVFVDTPDGVELVNPGQPSIEGTSLKGVTDLKGKKVADEYIAAAMKQGSAWVDYYWYRPGHNTPARKLTFVKKVQYGEETFIVGSGFYVSEDATLSRR
jgi:signal transduction histidine kinase